jgi:luciferase family oxidoreductase group 1
MANFPLRLSVLDIGPIRSNQSASTCMASIVDLARHAEDLGFHRYWLGEHHNVAAVAASQTAILSSVIAANTRSIRVGGCFLLAHYPPFLVAEQAAMVEACFPGRFDLGIGRSTGADRFASAMLRGGGASGQAMAPIQRLSELQMMLDTRGTGLDIGGTDYRLHATSNPATRPPLWVLGTSSFSARLAAHMGLPYAFGYHITGEGVEEALDTYRRDFQPSEHCPRPQTLLSAITVIGDTVEEAHRLARAQLHVMCAFRSGEPVGRQMLVEEAAATAFPTRHEGLLEMFGRTWVIDAPEAGAERLLALSARLGIDELMINPVAAAYESDPIDLAPNRRRTLTALAAHMATASMPLAASA